MREYRSHTTRDRRRALSLYAGGLSAAEVAKRTGLKAGTVWQWVKCAGRIRTQSEAQNIRRYGAVWQTPEFEASVRALHTEGASVARIARTHGLPIWRIRKTLRDLGLGDALAVRVRRHANDPSAPRGSRRIERIRNAARLHAEGLSTRAIGARLGCSSGTITRDLHTPYAVALRVFVHGAADEPKASHAHAMYWRQGLPTPLIAKVLDAEEADVRVWLGMDPAPPSANRTLSADQVRAIRAYHRANPDASLNAIAARFRDTLGVSRTTVMNVCRRATYTDIPDETQPEAPHA